MSKPTKQAAVVELPWGDRIVTFRYSGDIYVRVIDICRSIGLKEDKQFDKLRGHPALASQLIEKSPNDLGVKIGTANNADRKFLGISLKGMYAWLCGISLAQVEKFNGPEVADKLLAYQMECMDVLEAYWNSGVAINVRHFVDDQATRALQEGRIVLATEPGMTKQKRYAKVLATVFGKSQELDKDQLATALTHAAKSGSVNTLAEFLKALPGSRNRYGAMVLEQFKSHLEIIDSCSHSDLLVEIFMDRVMHVMSIAAKNQTRMLGYGDGTHVFWNALEESMRMFIVDVFGENALDYDRLEDFVVNAASHA